MPTTLLLSPRIFKPFYGPALSIPYDITPPSLVQPHVVQSRLDVVSKSFLKVILFSIRF
jgi:hypothetical protein